MHCGVILIRAERRSGRHLPFWAGRVSQLRPSYITTLRGLPEGTLPTGPQTGVPFVSRDRKGSAISPVWLGDFAHYQRASHPRSCRDRTHAAYPSHHYSYAALNEQHHRLLKGAPLRCNTKACFKSSRFTFTVWERGEQEG